MCIGPLENITSLSYTDSGEHENALLRPVTAGL